MQAPDHASEAAAPLDWVSILVRQPDGDSTANVTGTVFEEIAQATGNVFFGGAGAIELLVDSPKSQTADEWQAEVVLSVALIEFFSIEHDGVCAMLALSAEALDNALARFLGSSAPYQTGRKSLGVSDLELRFLDQVAPEIMQAIQPLVRQPLVGRRVLKSSDWKPSNSHALSVCSISAKQTPTSHLFLIAAPSHAIANDTGATERDSVAAFAADQAKVLELGKTRVKLAVSVRVADMTLDRLRALGAGDMIELSPAGLHEAKACVGGRGIFVGQIGRTANDYSIRVSDLAGVKSIAATSSQVES